MFNRNEIKMYSEGNLHVIINSGVNGFKSGHKYVQYSLLFKFFLTNVQVQQVCTWEFWRYCVLV